MGLEKGRTNNPYGRPAGSKNKATAEIRELLTGFISDNWDNMLEDFNKLEPKERLAFYEKILQYTLPRLQATTLENINPPALTVSYSEFLADLRAERGA